MRARSLIAGANVFFLSSREDPFPLVTLEAAQFAIPSVVFENATGLAPLISDGGGWIVGREGAADKIIELSGNVRALETSGLKARDRVLELFSQLRTMPKLFMKLRAAFHIPAEVSVVVPNYNHASYLFQRLESIRRQTFADFEVIILDDASTDNSRDIILKYDFDDRFSYAFNSEQSGSPFKQWLRGLSNANGRFTWIAESDDFCEDDFLQHTIAGFTNESVVISHCKTVIVDSVGARQPNALSEYLEKHAPGKFKKSYLQTGFEELNQCMAIRCTIVNASGVLFRTENLRRAVPQALDFKMCGDWMIYLLLLKEGSIHYSIKTANYFRRAETSIVKKIEGTDQYFEERSAIANHVAKHINLYPETSRKILLELESEWDRFAHVKKSKKSLDKYISYGIFKKKSR
jgi:glycosyltransferase involved in cell wall biosynthesis